MAEQMKRATQHREMGGRAKQEESQQREDNVELLRDDVPGNGEVA